MKLTNAQRKRLAALLKKTALEITAAEVAELATLKALAATEGVTLDAKFCEEAEKLADEGDAVLTDDQVKSLVQDGLRAALAEKGIDQGAILKAIEDGNKGHVTADAVKSAVEIAIKGVNTGVSQADMTAAVKAAVEEAQKSAITSKELANAFAESMKTFMEANAQTGKNVFPDNNFVGAETIEHRAGNLTVAQKELLNVIVGKAQNDGIADNTFKRATAAGAKAISGFRQMGVKALTTGGAATGAELIPVDLSSDLQMRLYLESQLAAAMVSQEINMPTDSYKLPLKTTRTDFYVGSEAPGSDPTGSQPGTGNIVLDASKLIGVADYSYEADEDSIVPILPMLQDDLASGAAAALEGALINGDTTATHMDSDYAAITGHHAKLLKGLRKLANAGSCLSSWAAGNVSAANILAALKLMKKYGVKRSDVILVCGPNDYNSIVGLAETLTAEKVGNPAFARILTGAAGVIYGVPIIVSEACRENLNATAVYDGVTTNRGSVLFVHKPSWYLGVRRGFTIETDQDKKKQTKSVIASFRRAFMPKETPSTTVPIVMQGYAHTS